MKIEPIYDSTSNPRHRAYCMIDDLQAGAASGTYTFVDSKVADLLGFASEILVIDQPGMILFFDNQTKVAYDWSKTE